MKKVLEGKVSAIIIPKPENDELLPPGKFYSVFVIGENGEWLDLWDFFGKKVKIMIEEVE